MFREKYIAREMVWNIKVERNKVEIQTILPVVIHHSVVCGAW